MTKETKQITYRNSPAQTIAQLVQDCFKYAQEGWTLPADYMAQPLVQMHTCHMTLRLERDVVAQACKDNPDLPEDFVEEALLAKAEVGEGKLEPRIQVPEVSEEKLEELKSLTKKNDLGRWCKQVGLEMKAVNPPTKWKKDIFALFNTEEG